MSKKIKVLCTLGPSSLTPSIIRKLSEEEVDMFRINLSQREKNKPLDITKKKRYNLAICTA